MSFTSEKKLSFLCKVLKSPERGAFQWLLILVCTLVVIGTLVLWQLSLALENANIEKTIRFKSNEIAGGIEGQVDNRVLALIRMANRWDVQGQRQRDKWEADAALYINHYPGFKAIEWTGPDLSPRWAVTPEGKIQYPMSIIPDSIWDKEVLAGAVSRHETVISRTAVAEGVKVFSVAVPVFNGKASDGFITGIFNIEELLASALLHEAGSGFSIAVSSGKDEIYRKTAAEFGENKRAQTSHIKFYNSDWTVKVWPGPEALKGMKSRLPEVILIVGIFIAVLLALVIYLAQTARSRAKAIEATNRDLEREAIERRKAEEALRENDELLKAILNNSTAVVYLKDAEGKYIFANRRFETIFNISQDFLSGKSDYDVFPAEIADAFRQNDMSAAHMRRPVEFEETVPQNDGVHTYLSVKFPLFNSSGEVYGVCGFSTDITERKNAEKIIEKHSLDLERSNAELEQYAYVVSHDLQEPLRVVTGYVQLLAKRYKGRLDSDADEFINFAVDGASRMQRLIHDLLSYSRVGRGDSKFAPVDCNVIFERTIPYLKKSIEESKAVITKDRLPTIIGSDTQLDHLFLNLISNSLKYRSERPPLIHVSAEKKQDSWLFSFTDNGIGIDPKYSEKVFEIFERLHGKMEYSGTGIGLAICKKVVENHGGRIWVESQPGAGSTFYFTVPHKTPIF